MILNREQLRLVAFLLSDLLQREDEWFSDLDDAHSGVIFMKNHLARKEFQEGITSQEERDARWTEADRESDELDSKLADWRYERWHLEQFLRRLQDDLRRPHAVAA